MRSLLAPHLLLLARVDVRSCVAVCLLSWTLACSETENPDAGVGSPPPVTGGSVSPSGSFPRSAEPIDVDMSGPYHSSDYPAPSDPTLGPSTIFYPTDAAPPFALLALCPGFTNDQNDFLWWGPVMASHGFVLMVISPENTLLDMPPDRADDLDAAIGILKGENTRAGSPLVGKLDTARTGIMGHSMGGGGVLIALNRSGSKYRAGIAMEPWEEPDFASVTAPTLILAGEVDLVAPPDDMAWPFYQQIPNSTHKVYAEFAGMEHNTPNNLGYESEHEAHARWSIAFAKLRLEDDARYDSFLQNAPELSRFARTP